MSVEEDPLLLLEKTEGEDVLEITGDGFEAEKAVGIIEFVNKETEGFSGILKHRFSDFKVIEIGLDGQLAILGDKLCDESLLIGKEKEVNTDGSTATSVEDLKTSLGSILGNDESFIQCILELASEDRKTSVEELLTCSIPEKQARTSIHQAIRTHFKGALQTEAVGDQIKIYRKGATLAKRSGQRDDRNSKPVDQQRYLQFVLYKENMDTIDAIQLISKRLHMSARDFTYAGTKDKRGITMQRIIARNVTPAKILGINKLFDSSTRLKVGDIRLAEQALSLGDLQGNRFELVIRNITGVSEEELLSSIESFAKNGFINYFGLQRFGTTSVASHQIGLALLRGDYQQAICLILDPRQDEGDQRAVAARRHWKETGDTAASQQMFPHRYTAERQILAHYSRDPVANRNDHLGAILSINRELRLMYVHSVQSLLWNRLASYRVAKLGLALVEGDLALPKGTKTPILVTLENISQYCASDIVLPVPGYASVIPANELGEQLKKELESLDIESLELAFKPKNKALWDLPGAYRYVFVTLEKDVQFQIGHYNEADQELPEQFDKQPNGEYLGLAISFNLPTSAYATMALRELMHCGTDPRQHKQRTKRHRKESRIN